MKLNQRALRRCEHFIEQASLDRVAVSRDGSGARLVDCGIHVPGGLEAGRGLTEICMAGLGHVSLVPGDRSIWPGTAVTVHTDQPVAACMASQYAGWQVAEDKFFAMGSGPMRALRGREKLFEEIGYQESWTDAVGVLESSTLPQHDVCRHIAEQCSLDADHLTLLVAPSTSIAGTIQVVARTIETALHKMHELGFDLRHVISGFGTAPLPPVAETVMGGIGRTNDAILYGGEVSLWVRCDDEILQTYGPRVPSTASEDHGRPFAEIFQRYEGDFYRIDPLLFSPAVVHFVNLQTGNVFRFGEWVPEVLQQSFSSRDL